MRPSRPHDVGRRTDEFAHISHEYRVFTRNSVNGAQQRNRVHELPTGIRQPIDLLRSGSIPCRKLADALRPARARLLAPLGQMLHELSHISDRGDIRPAIEVRLSVAAVGGNQRARATDMPSVVEAKVAWHPAKITLSASRSASRRRCRISNAWVGPSRPRAIPER